MTNAGANQSAHGDSCDVAGNARRVANALLTLASRYGNIAASPEIARFATGTKPVIRMVVPLNSRSECEVLFESVGLDWEFRALHVEACGGTWNSISPPDGLVAAANEAAVYVSHERSASLQAANADVSASDLAGILFGYPACCVNAVSELAGAGESWPELLVRRSGAPDKWHAAANRVVADWGGIPPVGELFPCSLACPFAIALGIAGVDALVQLGLHRLAAQIRLDATRAWLLTEAGRARPNSETNSYRLQWT